MVKIPESAERVFDGRFKVYRWNQKMFDGSYQVFERLVRRDTVEALVVVGEKILVLEQEQPHIEGMFLSLPGGGIEKGEDPITATKRETLEETGYEAAQWELLYSNNPLQNIDWAIHVFVARDAKQIASPMLDVGEKIRARLVDFDELIDLVDSGEFSRIEQNLRVMLVRAKYHAHSKEELKKKIFGQDTHS